jgi:hypothetical protein
LHGLSVNYREDEAFQSIIRMMGAIQLAPTMVYNFALQLIENKIDDYFQGEISDKLKAVLVYYRYHCYVCVLFSNCSGILGLIWEISLRCMELAKELQIPLNLTTANCVTISERRRNSVNGLLHLKK